MSSLCVYLFVCLSALSLLQIFKPILTKFGTDVWNPKQKNFSKILLLLKLVIVIIAQYKQLCYAPMLYDGSP